MGPGFQWLMVTEGPRFQVYTVFRLNSLWNEFIHSESGQVSSEAQGNEFLEGTSLGVAGLIALREYRGKLHKQSISEIKKRLSFKKKS